ncbi:hypothetical protein [Pseudomarimonas salicorniae]|uniref:Glycerophosphoryl diester phosphodiesterase membrane domain-containing protein n=1 Tax=Pseudomarimonas salicorniae TaxID=2933270 RepID=A0ABT0GGK2_9GAMM|nr:hypothetical protein [Lysobacter sp. CAU 1642]MCK7593681.1 hypothetical protein [Lysobacter sp. CAU 1642]
MRRMVPVNATLPAEPGDIGRQLEAAFRTFWVHWKPGFLLAFIGQLIGLLPAVLMPRGGDPMQTMDGLIEWYSRPGTWLLFALVVVCQVFLFTALSYRLGCCGRGQDPGLVASVNRALARFASALGAFLLYVGGLLLSMLPMLMIVGWAASDGLAPLTRSLIGLLALAALGLPTWWSLAASLNLFAVALERRSAMAAISRSLALIRGHWWISSAVLGIVLLVHLTVSLVIGLVIGMVALGSTMDTSPGDPSQASSLLIGVQLLMSPLAALLQVLLVCGLLALFNQRVLAVDQGAGETA